MRKFLISIGHPLYILLKFFISPPLTLNKVRRKKLFKFFELRGGVRGGDTRKKTRKKEVVIYHAKTPYLKNFLKAIYPLTQVRLPVLKIPTLKIHWKLLALVFIGSIGIYFYVFKDLPAPSSLTTQPVPLTTHIRDRYGVELYKIYASQNRTLVKLSDLPLTLRQATIAIEDAEFYQHSGFSLRGIFRALISNSSLLST